MRVVHDSIHAKDRKKEEAAANKAERAVRSSGLSTTEGSGRGSTIHLLGEVLIFFCSTNRSWSTTFHHVSDKKREKQEADRVMGKCLFWSDLPLSITKNNPFWQPMCDAIVVVGPGYKSATYEELRGPILQAEKEDINSRLAELKQSWEVWMHNDV
jgi:hypothetical protein